MPAYYNEHDKFAAEWLRNLIKAGLIPAGDVDERDIREVRPSDLGGYIQHHFFAGIGGWPYALRLAEWPDYRPVVTGSCPCQPFSAAGKRQGVDDPRHLWPAFRWLIAHIRPATVFGEQVASRDGVEWLAGVRADMEALGYAIGCADLPAASVGAPHRRQRLWWVADRIGERIQHQSGARRRTATPAQGEAWERQRCGDDLEHGREIGGLAHPKGDGRQQGRAEPERRESTERCGRMGHTGSERPQGGKQAGTAPWSTVGATVPCRDGKTRRVEPGICPLAHGVPGRVGKLRGFGNAIVPQVAAEFIRSVIP